MTLQTIDKGHFDIPELFIDSLLGGGVSFLGNKAFGGRYSEQTKDISIGLSGELLDSYTGTE